MLNEIVRAKISKLVEINISDEARDDDVVMHGGLFHIK